jgi:hypothetical protein
MQSRPALLRLTALGAASGLALLGLVGCADAGPPVSNAVANQTPGDAAGQTPASAATGGDEKGATPDSQQSPTGEPATPTTTKPRQKPTDTKKVDVELKSSDQVAVVRGFGAGGGDGVDTFDVSFTKPISGYTLRYVDQLTEDPSGKAVDLKGKAILLLVVHNATTDSTPYVSGSTKPTKFSPAIAFAPRMLAISEVKLVGDFEATLSVGIGVSEKNLPFKATLQDKGTRLTIDISQP